LKKRKQSQKNSTGSHSMESVTSPEKMTPPQKQNKTKKQLMDLTLDEEQEDEQNSLTRNRQKGNQRMPRGRTRPQGQ
jgi:hypothetical protein